MGRKRGGERWRTSPTTPATTTAKFTLCCVDRTAFSAGERSDHRTWPVSPVNVMLLRCGPGGGAPGVVVCVACRVWDVEKGVVSFALRGCVRGRRKDGRRSAMASVGLYIAAMVSALNTCVKSVSSFKM